MESVTLQSGNYPSLIQKAAATRNFKQLNRLISRTLSEPGLLMVSFLQEDKPQPPIKHNINVNLVIKFFGDLAMNATGDANLFPVGVDTLLKKIEQANKQEDYLRVCFLIMLSPQLYDNSNLKLLKRLEELLHRMSDQSRSQLVRWMRDIDAARLSKIVGCVQHALTQQVVRSQPNTAFKQKMAPLSSNGQTVLLHCRLLQMFFRTNQLSERISYEKFKNKKVMELYKPLDQFKAHFKGAKLLDFLRYPFLLDLAYLNVLDCLPKRLLQMETLLQHKLNMKKGLREINQHEQVLDELEDAADNQLIMAALFLHIEVRRNSLFEDAIEQLSNLTGNLKSPLKVKIRGEPANDAGGVKKEFFQLVMSEVFNPNRDMFVRRADDRFHWFNGLSTEAPAVFGFVGMLVGLSIYNGVMMDLKFPRVFYKKMLAPEDYVFDSVEDLKQHEPDYYKSFKYLLSTDDPLEELELTFSTEMDSLGKKALYEFKLNGRNIKLSQGNKREYVSLFTKWLINHSIARQFRPFREGFYRVVTGHIIKMFQAEQLERVLCGQQVLDFKQLQKTVKYQGYTAASTVIKYFWDVLHSFDMAAKKMFLVFVTGTDRVPIGGLGNLKLTMERMCPDSDNLPTSRTCSNLLLLPQYSSKNKLKTKLLLALEHREGFGLI